MYKSLESDRTILEITKTFWKFLEYSGIVFKILEHSGKI